MSGNNTLIDQKVIDDLFKKKPQIMKELPVSIYTLSENHNWAARVVKNKKFNTDQYVSYPYFKPISLMVDFKELFKTRGEGED